MLPSTQGETTESGSATARREEGRVLARGSRVAVREGARPSCRPEREERGNWAAPGRERGKRGQAGGWTSRGFSFFFQILFCFLFSIPLFFSMKLLNKIIKIKTERTLQIIMLQHECTFVFLIYGKFLICPKLFILLYSNVHKNS